MTSDSILAVDPGREKCGVAVVDGHGAILDRAIVARQDIVVFVGKRLHEFGLSGVVIGHATGFGALQKELLAAMPELEIVLVNETGSTLEARALYWRENPPRGWRRLLPLSLQTPPVPVDDYAAVVLARRALANETR